MDNKESILLELENGNMTFEYAIFKLTECGYSKEEAKEIASETYFELKRREIHDIEVEERRGIWNKVAFFFIVLISITSAMAGIFSIVGNGIGIVLLIVVSYFGFKENRISAIPASLIYYISTYVLAFMYFKDRETYYNIEILFPIIGALIPSYPVFLLLNKVIYKE